MSPTPVVPPALSADEARALLELAREAIRLHLAEGRLLAPPPGGPAALERTGGMFVTLRSGGDLRGCIGWVTSDEPLRSTVVRCAVAAATEDPRFPPVRPEELPGIRIEVSVLSPLRRVTRPEKIEVGRDGLLIEGAGRRGLLLPQVAAEMNWGREEFLDGVCRKAGLPPGAWREGLDLHRFTAEVFSEADPG